MSKPSLAGLAALLASCAAAAIAPAAAAATAPAASAGHWVSIGAFRARAAAAQLAADAAIALATPFSAQAADVPGQGLLHRVLTGPYATRNEALGVAAQIRTQGFKDAWVVVLAADAPVSSLQTVAAAPVPATGPTTAAVPTTAAAPTTTEAPVWVGDSDLPPIEVLLQGLPDVPATPAAPPPLPTEQAGPSPVGEAPADYQLHKMRRRGASRGRAPSPTHWASDFDMRAKWYLSALDLPPGDAMRQATGDAMPVRHHGDLRLMWRPSFGQWRLLIDHAITWRPDPIAATSPGFTFDQTPLADRLRLWDLAWAPGNDADATLRYRFDRLAVEHRTESRAVTLGRQAVSWGGGLVFQPMDLFNPFAPTTVDQDYKVGDDMLRFEQLFPGGSELQLLAVGRTSPAGKRHIDVASFAAKYRAVAAAAEVELLAAHHYGAQVLGVGLRVPAGGMLVRSDIVWTSDGNSEYLSGVLNADYSFGLGGTTAHVFGEYFYNGFGVLELPPDLRDLPDALVARLGRGEVFNLMRHYAALGLSFRWHYLLNQSLAVIGNLHDGSLAAQASLAYDASDASRLQIGLTHPFGSAGDEFGSIAVGDDLTVGGGKQAYVRFVYFF